MKLEEMTDEALVLLCREGEGRAFDEIDRRYRGRLRSFLVRRGGLPEADAEDATQTALIKAFRSFSQLQEIGHLASWLFRIAARAGVDVHRRRTPVPFQDITCPKTAREESDETWTRNLIDPAAREPGEVLSDREEQENIWRRARQILSPGEFALLWLACAEDRSYQEIAVLLKKKPGAVRTALFRIRRKLLTVLADHS